LNQMFENVTSLDLYKLQRVCEHDV
jgi:hypothetical protein